MLSLMAACHLNIHEVTRDYKCLQRQCQNNDLISALP